jgi:DNA-binding NarL/FixJ family response regulator
MRVILVGTPRQRDDLRDRLDVTDDVVAEFESVAAARQSGIVADGILLPAEPAAHIDDDGPVQETLTPREIEVLELAGEGLANKEIAERLGISDQTVKFHLGSINGKLGASNRTDAVRRAMRRGLITL